MIKRVMIMVTLNSILLSQNENYYGTVAVSLIDAPTKFYSVSFTNKLEKVFSESGFDVVERNSINKIMKEWKINTSGVSNEEYKGIGEILSADYLIVGSVDDDELNVGIYCVIKMIEVQTGKLMEAASIDGQIKSKKELYSIGIESIIEQLVYGTNQKMNDYEEASIAELNNKIIEKQKQEQEQQKLESQLEIQEIREKRKNQFFKAVYDVTIGVVYFVIRLVELLITIEENEEEYYAFNP